MNTDYAWAAGFWDGEGCVSLGTRGAFHVPRITVQVAQVDREVLDRLQRILGYGNVLGPYEPRHQNAQPYYVWRVEGVIHLNSIREKLGPYLGTVKLKQMDDAIKARKIWEETGRCDDGHRLRKSDKGLWYCKECRSSKARISANNRWEKVKQK